MEINIDLAVTSEEFFDYLQNSIVKDVRAHTNKSIQKSEVVEGYSYTKTLETKSGETELKFILSQFIFPTVYVANIKKEKGENIVSIKAKDLENGKINVTYSEEFIPVNIVRSWNFKLINFFHKRKVKKNIKEGLKYAEDYIIKNRKAESPE